MSGGLVLDEEASAFVEDLVAQGDASPGEVVRDGPRLLEEREALRRVKLTALREAIREGLDSGPPEPLDLDAIRREARGVRDAAVRG